MRSYVSGMNELEESLTKTITSIIVRFTFEAVHYWPDAPAIRREHYLRYPHRHLFQVEATRLVMHDNRDVEFIAFKRRMETYCRENWSVELEPAFTYSCEQFAKILLEEFDLSSCRVFEDNENGAEVTRIHS